MSLLDRLAHRIAGPTIGQLRNELVHTRRTLDEVRDACLHAEKQHDEARHHLTNMLAVARTLAAERDALQARLDALTPAPVRPLSEERRRVILDAVNDCAGDVHSPTAESIADYLTIGGLPGVFSGLAPTSIARFVSRLAAEPERWLVSDGKKPARYSLTDAGRADLAGVAA